MSAYPTPSSHRHSRSRFLLGLPLLIGVGTLCLLLVAMQQGATVAAPLTVAGDKPHALTVNQPQLQETESPSQTVSQQTVGATTPYPTFQAGPALLLDELDANTTDVAIGDLDNDGDFDIVLGNRGYEVKVDDVTKTITVANTIFLNDSTTGNFQLSAPQFFGPANGPNLTVTVALGDMNSDGFLDIVVGLYGGQNAVYLNNPKAPGDFAQAITLPVGSGSDPTTSVAIGDLDGDARYDLVIGNNGESSQIYLNSKAIDTPIFTSWPTATLASNSTTSVAMGDLDQDGLLDIVLGNDNAPNMRCANNGALVFACTPFGDPQNATTAIALADVDQDGQLEIIESIEQQPIQIHYPTGAVLPLTSERGYTHTTSLAVADMNHDGQLDIVAGSNGAQNLLYTLMPGQAIAELSTAISPRLSVDSLGRRAQSNANKGAVAANQASSSTTNESTRVFAMPNHTNDIVVADLDNDGDLDLIAANDASQSSQIYFSNGGGVLRATSFLPPSTVAEAEAVSKTAGSIPGPDIGTVAWGDANGDGYLDIAASDAASRTQLLFLYNPATEQFVEPPISFGTSGDYPNIAWGGFDSDGGLDFAASSQSYGSYPNDAPTPEMVTLYANTGSPGSDAPRFQPLFAVSPTLSPEFQPGGDLIVGDVNQDQRLDLAVVSWSERNHLLYNQSADGERIFNPVAIYDESDIFGDALSSEAGAFGDVNGDGAPDLVVINSGFVNKIYLNDGNGNYPPDQVRSFGNSGDLDYNVALGDLDGDGWLDIVVGLQDQASKIYLNDRGGYFSENRVSRFGSGDVADIAVVDIDGDGDLDLAVAGELQGSMVYLNQGFPTVPFVTALTLGDGALLAHEIAAGDSNGDGTMDLALAAKDRGVALVTNHSRVTKGLPMPPVAITVTRPLSRANASFFSAAEILTAQRITIPFGLSGPAGGKVSRVKIYVSLNGGGKWYEAGTIDGPLAVNQSHSFEWDTYKFGLMGQADNLVIRVEAYPIIKPIINGIPGPYLWPYVTAVTYPFRVRGALPQVLRQYGDSAGAVPGAYLFRYPAGDDSAFRYGTPTNIPYVTNQEGFLLAPTVLLPGEQWVAMMPSANSIDVRSAITYMLLSASASTIDSLTLYTVDRAGVHTLTVSAENTVVLFDLGVALEWDISRNDPYWLQLERDLLRTANHLYDWSDGQILLGNITVYTATYAAANDHWAPSHDGQPNADEDDEPLTWRNAADIQIYAGNHIRPNADVGGNLSRPVTVPVTLSVPLPDGMERRMVHYVPGQIRIGRNWNRYGDRSGDIGEDWSLALAHELSHYLLRLQDNYLALDTKYRLVTFTGCPDVMTNPYLTEPQSSEFLAEVDDSRCDRESYTKPIRGPISQFVTGLSDWDVITHQFNQLRPAALPGPDYLPLDITRVRPGRVQGTASLSLLERNRYVINTEPNGGRVSDNARAYLFHNDTIPGNRTWRPAQIVALGNPQLGQITAWGAHRGDQVCVYDFYRTERRAGCTPSLTNRSHLPKVSETQIPLGKNDENGAWPPQIRVQPGTSLTLTTDYQSDKLWARLYPLNVTYPPTITAQYSFTTRFTATDSGQIGLIQLPPIGRAIAGYILIWEGPAEGPDLGAPDARHFVIDFTLGGSPCCHNMGDRTLKVSPDGEVIFYALNYTDTRNYFGLQALNQLPDPPAWAKPVGQGYLLDLSPNTSPTILEESYTSLMFNYLDRHVTPGEEAHLKIYYTPLLSDTLRAGSTVTWTPLDTSLNLELNTASVLAKRPGIYVLMSSIAIPLNEGWNLIGYPNVQPQPVDAALSAIDGSYAAILGYDAKSEKWQSYPHQPLSSTLPLTELNFAKGYWLYVTEPITLYLRGSEHNSPFNSSPVATTTASMMPQPPVDIVTGTIDGALITTLGTAQSTGHLPALWIRLEDDAGNMRCRWAQAFHDKRTGAYHYAAWVSTTEESSPCPQDMKSEIEIIEGDD